jgi:sugar lactone lactonase YvrE
MAAQTFFNDASSLQIALAAVALAMASATAAAQTNFGSVNLGASASSSVTLTIPSATTLGSVAVVTQGATALDFTNGGAGTCVAGTNYLAAQTCTVQVNFKPVYAGERYGAVLLMNGSGNRVATASLEGTGTGPQVAFGGGSAISFDPQVNGVALKNPFDVAVDGKGDLFIADSDNARVVELPSGSGAPIAIDPTVGGSGLSNPGGVAVDGAGDLFISDLDRNFVVEVPVGGGSPILINPIVNGTGLHYPCGMIVDGAGDLYIADVDNGRVVEVPAGSGAPIAIDPLVDGEKLSYPVTLALDSSGDLFIADLFANRVVEVPAGGSAPIAIDPSVNGQSLDFPYGIAVDGAGDLFIADANNRVVQVTVNGGPATAITPSANGEGLNDPIGMAVSSGGDLFVADSLNNRVVQVVRSQPPMINFAATAAGKVSSDSPQTVMVENVGNAPLSFAVPATGNNPSISANFTLNSTTLTACPLLTPGSPPAGSLAAGATCILPISFQPAAAGTILGTLTLTDNNMNAGAPAYTTQTIALSGGAPAADLTATMLSFGPQQVETASAPQQVTLINVGTAALAITNITVTGAGASSFAFPNPCSSNLAAEGHCVLQGTFTPAGAGASAATVTIADNAPGSPQTVALTGIGVYPSTVSVTPAPISINTAQALAVTVAVGGASGEPTPTGSVVVTIGSYVSTAAVLASGIATVNIPAGSLAAGTDNIGAVYTPDSASASLYASASGESSVTVISSPTATAPAASTSAATAVTAGSAMLAATVNPNGADTHAWFLYGTSSTLSGANQTASQDLGATAAGDPVTAAISGLSVSMMYYYQVIAQNSVGTTNGAIFSFTTTPAPYFQMVTGAPMSVAPGAATGNTTTVQVTPWYGFTGTVNLSCAIAPTATSDPPTCNVPASVTISNGSAQTATLTVNTTATSAQNKPSRPLWPSAGGAILACVLLFVFPTRRRSCLAMLAWVALFAALGAMGCGGGGNAGSSSGGSGGSQSNPGTTAGTYTVTITGTSGSMTETGTVALTVQ